MPGVAADGHIGFNTQPPEGGWVLQPFGNGLVVCFNTQPPEGGWGHDALLTACCHWFQHTAARRRLAGATIHFKYVHTVSTHSRPKAAG